MRFIIFLIFILFISGCSQMPFSNSFSANYSSSNSQIKQPIKIELAQLTGNDLSLFLERPAFMKKFKEKLISSGKFLFDDDAMLHLRIYINKSSSDSKEYKTKEHGVTIYHLDTPYKITINYKIVDDNGYNALIGTIKYNVLVKSKSALDYNDAKRVALLRLSETLGIKTAQSIINKSYILAQRYNLRTKDFKNTHNKLCPTP